MGCPLYETVGLDCNGDQCADCPSRLEAEDDGPEPMTVSALYTALAGLPMDAVICMAEEGTPHIFSVSSKVDDDNIVYLYT